jgi:hypothetical protein
LNVPPSAGGSSITFLVSRRRLVAHLRQDNLQEGGWVADSAYLQHVDIVPASLHEAHLADQLEIERLQAELAAARMHIEDALREDMHTEDACQLIEDLEKCTKPALDGAEVPDAHGCGCTLPIQWELAASASRCPLCQLGLTAGAVPADRHRHSERQWLKPTSAHRLLDYPIIGCQIKTQCPILLGSRCTSPT